jgi:hypothetical protein
LRKTGRCLSKWEKGIYSNTKVLMHASLLVILHLDMVQDNRRLYPEELDIRARLKRKFIALAVVERARKKQCARVANIKEGDANTKFFHMRVNARRRKNHIHLLKKNQGWVTDHDAKENIIFEHFQSVMGRGEPSARYFNWGELSFDNPALHTHGDPLTEKEVKVAIVNCPVLRLRGQMGSPAISSRDVGT